MKFNDYTIRPAIINDCACIASLYSIASDGVSDYIWSKLAAPGEDILDVGRQRYERTNTLFSFENCTILEKNNAVAGMLVAFPMHVDPNQEESDPVLVPYSKLEQDDSYYICGIALFEEYRGQGAGSRLMQLAENHASEKGYNTLSLIVFEQNENAKKLYERIGYHEIAREKIVPHPMIRLTGDAILMAKNI